MNSHKYRIPVDEPYIHLLGKAVYSFAYYEWRIIFLIERLSPGFPHEYFAQKTTYTNVKNRLKKAVQDAVHIRRELQDALKACHGEFAGLIPRRNALIHAHPITDVDGAQRLVHNERPGTLPDMKWSSEELIGFVEDVERASLRRRQGVPPDPRGDVLLSPGRQRS